MVTKSHLTRDSERFLLFLMDQQFYCWGKDILSPLGNLFLQEGFKRTRAPHGIEISSSAYEKELKEMYLCLWGLGFFFGKKGVGGIFFSRNKFPPSMIPRWKQPDPYWMHRQSKGFSSPQTEKEMRTVYSLLKLVFSWFSELEGRSLKHRGEEYRRMILSERNLRFLPERLAPKAWSELALACDANSPYDAFRLLTKKYKLQIKKPSNRKVGAKPTGSATNQKSL